MESPAACPTSPFLHFRPDLLVGLLCPAFTVAMLGAIESLMSAVVSDRMSNDKHNPNVELFGQGVANIFFADVRRIAGHRRDRTHGHQYPLGAQSPVAGMIHALTILCVLLFAAPLASYVPMATLAGILMVVAYNMGEWREIPQLLKLTKTDITVWLVTFPLTVFTDLTVAVEVGMILAALMFIGASPETTTITGVTEEYIQAGRNTSSRTKIFRTTPLCFAFTVRFCSERPRKPGVVTEKIHRPAAHRDDSPTQHERDRRDWTI